MDTKLKAKNSEYDQEITQSQTEDKPMAPRGRATQPSQDTRKTNQAKQPAPPPPPHTPPHQDDRKSRMDTKQAEQNIKQSQTPTTGVTINKKSTTTEPLPLEQTAAEATGGGLNAFYWYQIFALDTAVVEAQETPSPHGSTPTNAMHHHGETLIKLTHYDETKKRVHDPQTVKSQRKPKAEMAGPATDKAPGTNRSKAHAKEPEARRIHCRNHSTTMIGFKSRHADCRIKSKLYPTFI